jgi:hypothetical protein
LLPIERDGLCSNKVRQALKSPEGLSRRDRNELDVALKNDLTAKCDQSKNEARSRIFEDFVCNYLARNNIYFRRQEEIGAQQLKEHGVAIATPDILLDEPLFINDTKIYWIDAKDSYGTDCSMTRSRLVAQVICCQLYAFLLNFTSLVLVPSALFLCLFSVDREIYKTLGSWSISVCQEFL